VAGGFDVVVLAGGRSSRFGSDKVLLLLDSVLAGLPDEAAVVCVGPRLDTARAGVRWVREDPPYAGPLAAVAAGLAAGVEPLVVLLGADMPAVAPAVSALVEAVGPGNGAVLVDVDGWPQVLASAWRRDVLQERLAALGPLEGSPLRLLLDGASLVPVPDQWGAAHDVDTPADLES
jgi:molybdopterin-guanine dinucleotide biosynthesis protein A